MWLILTTPAAEPIVGPWRAEYDWTAQFGVPAHITVRNPFLPPEQWTDPAIETLEDWLPVEVTLDRVENRPDALVIVAEPDDSLHELTARASSLWPQLPPHKDGMQPVSYHMTIGRDPAFRDAATAAIAPQLPLRVEGTQLWAVAPSGDGLRHSLLAKVG
jgi:hypothetical protein